MKSSFSKFVNAIDVGKGCALFKYCYSLGDAGNDNSFKGTVTLFYSVKSEEELIGDVMFKELSQKSNKFVYIPWITSTNGRMNIKKIFELSGKFKNKHFFLCGPTRFKEGIMNSLIENGFGKRYIHEEVFDFR